MVVFSQSFSLLIYFCRNYHIAKYIKYYCPLHKNMTIYIVTQRCSHTPLLIRVINIINSKVNGTPKSVYLHIITYGCVIMTEQVNSLRLKESVASKWASKNLWEYHLFCCWWYILSILHSFLLSLFFFFFFLVCPWP